MGHMMEADDAAAELAENLRIVMREYETLHRILSSDRQLVAATDKIKQLHAENDALRERVAGLMVEKNDAIRAARKPKVKA